jgi:hypothetical protein
LNGCASRRPRETFSRRRLSGAEFQRTVPRVEVVFRGGDAVSERAEQLATRLDQELSRMIGFVSGLTESQLDAACQDPQGGTVRHVLAHLREGTDQVVAWAASVSPDPSNGASAAPPVPAAHSHAHPHPHAHSHPHPAGPGQPAADVEQTVGQLRDGGSVIVGAVRGLSDRQLDQVPPATEGLADGATPLHGIVAFIADDVAGHLRYLKAAVGADVRVPQDVA